MRRPAALAAIALAALFSACRPKAPVAPLPPPSPQVVAVQPPARSAGYAYDGQIWALFDRPLDPRSVDTTTVFLKQDTRRVSCFVSYEPISRRIVLVPRVALTLRTTYTVVLTMRVRSAEGVFLAQDYLWQFSTSSIRRLTYLAPAPNEVTSPVANLRWSSADAVPGSLRYDVYAGTDSLAVLARTAPLLERGTNSFHLPRASWPSGQRVYWAVSTTNLSTGEHLDSPVTGFDVLPADAPTRTLNVNALEWGGIQAGRPTLQLCARTDITVGTGYNSAVRFDLDPSRLGTRVRSARLVMYSTNNSHQIPQVSASFCTPVWSACGMVYPGPPYVDPGGTVARARVGLVPNEAVFESAGLAAWVEGMLRRGDFSGLMFTLPSTNPTPFNMTNAIWPRPLLQVVVYE